MSSLRISNKKKFTTLRKKEFLVITIIALIIFSAIFIYTYILYTPLFLSKHPKIYITCDEEIEQEEYVNCTFSLQGETREESIDPINSKIKIRGMVNARFPKKGYRLELSQQLSLLGMRKDDDWTLFALYLDYPRMRVKISMDLWRSLEETDPSAILPKSKYINLFINNEFKGLYLLAEKNDRRLFKLDDALKNIDSSLIFQEKSYDSFRSYIGWEQDWPNEYEGYYIMEEIMTDLINFINNSRDEEFFDPEVGVYTKFDKLNLIDFYIYNFFILHKDFWSNNFYIIRNTYPNKFHLIPWDFDASLGQKGSTKHSPYENPELDARKTNELYRRLIDNDDFMISCKQRWRELRTELWTDDFISKMFSNTYEKIKDSLAYEMQIWASTIEEENSEKDFNLYDYVDHLFHWIDCRLEFCDLYFEFL